MDTKCLAAGADNLQKSLLMIMDSEGLSCNGLRRLGGFNALRLEEAEII